MANYAAGDVLPADDLNWTTWTPTLTNLTLGSGTVVARYLRIGNSVWFKFKFTLGAGSAVGSAPVFTLPAAASTSFGTTVSVGVATYEDTGSNQFRGAALLNSSATDARLRYYNPGVSDVSATVPHTWASTDYIFVEGFYEAA